jgi:hypothetical protein
MLKKNDIRSQEDEGMSKKGKMKKIHEKNK